MSGQISCKNKPIGGYFELELPVFHEYHKTALSLNSGRFCLEYIIKVKRYTKIYIPYYTCDSVLEPLIRNGIDYEFYHIDKCYQLLDKIVLKDSEALLYTNYWGLQNEYCKKIHSIYGKQLILDYTQAFFSKPIAGVDTFYSCRKFFGVPDGGYLYLDGGADFEIEQDESYMRMNSLVKRIDLSPEGGYEDFHKTESAFRMMSIRHMSKLTKRLLQSINYERVAQQRINNYNTLRSALGGRKLNCGEVPMIFPYESPVGPDLRKRLIANKIFVAKYWPSVETFTEEGSVERWIANHILPLPIDQRYDTRDMERIVSLIQQ